jgi:hypothetical protein
MKVFYDFNHVVEDVLIAVTAGLKIMPEALGAVFPVQPRSCKPNRSSNSK